MFDIIIKIVFNTKKKIIQKNDLLAAKNREEENSKEQTL